MAKSKPGQKVFNDRPRKVFRKRISNGEVYFSASFVAIVLGMALWFIAQRDNYDPGERDISMEVMIASSVKDELYEPPLQRWIDPAMAAHGGGAVPVVDYGIMPDTISQNGWQPSSRLEQFDKSNLYEKINGQEVQYHSYGFEHLHFISTRNDAADLDGNVEVYDMGSFSNALGVFGEQRGDGTTVEKQGAAILYETEAGAIGLIGKYYVKVSGSASKPEMRQFGRDFVVAFAADNAADVVIPGSMTLLTDSAGIDFAGLQYVREDVFQYAFAKEFWFGRPSEASNARYFVHQGASAEEAQKLVDQILEEHQYDYTQLEAGGEIVVLQHNFLKNFFSIVPAGNFVVGMERADTQEEALEGAAKMRDAALGFDTAAAPAAAAESPETASSEAESYE